MGKLNKCDHCASKQATIHFNSIGFGQEEVLCSNCFNEKLANELDVSLIDNPTLIIFKDKNQKSRHFYVEKMLFPTGISIEANENNAYGYRFAVHGKLDCDQNALFEQLFEKIQQGLSTTYVKQGEFPNGQQYHTMKSDVLVGRIESSEENWNVPTMVIDGKPYSWEEFGKMMMSNEGFQLRMEIFDITDDAE